VALSLAAASCAGTHGGPPKDDAAIMAWARQEIERGEGTDAALALREFLSKRAGSRYIEEARLLLGRALYVEGNDAEAEVEFEGMLRDFPAGEFAPQARYYLALSLLSQSHGPQLDQTETRRSLFEFQHFLDAYPEHPLAERARGHIASIRSKLAEKEYKNGELYRRRHNHDAARFYFRSKVIEPYGDTPWDRKAMLGLVKSYDETKDWPNVALWACSLQKKYPNSSEAEEARGPLHRAMEHGYSCDDAASSPAGSP
jgi:outer membrane assembly lipoprotein YfiO